MRESRTAEYDGEWKVNHYDEGCPAVQGRRGRNKSNQVRTGCLQSRFCCMPK